MIILPIAFTVLAVSVFASGEDEAMKQEMILSIVPGYVVTFVFFIMISMTTAFLKDRDLGMTARIASTPLSPQLYLLGKWIPYMFIVWIQIIILIAFGKVVYDLPIVQPLFVFFLSIALSFMATGFGLVLSLFVKTENMGIALTQVIALGGAPYMAPPNALTQVIALGGAMLGGLWMPLDLLPDIIQKIAHLLPQYYAHQALQDALNGTLTYKAFFQGLFTILAYGCAGFILGIIRYPHFLKQARG